MPPTHKGREGRWQLRLSGCVARRRSSPTSCRCCPVACAVALASKRLPLIGSFAEIAARRLIVAVTALLCPPPPSNQPNRSRPRKSWDCPVANNVGTRMRLGPLLAMVEMQITSAFDGRAEDHRCVQPFVRRRGGRARRRRERRRRRRRRRDDRRHTSSPPVTPMQSDRRVAAVDAT